MTKFYAIKKGRSTGIVMTWSECQASVSGYSGSLFKAFKTREEAEEYLKEGGISNDKKESIQASSIQASSVQSLLDEVQKNPAALTEPIMKNIESKSSPDLRQVFTDGSCIDGVGGYGYVIVDSNVEKCGRVPLDPCTNQKAELYAIRMALNDIKGEGLEIVTDSKYAIGCLSEWWFSWINNGWKTSNGSPVKNKDLIEECLYLMRGKEIVFTHVLGHKGNIYNEKADILANQGRLQKE